MLDRVQQAYEEMRAYFTRPGAIIARDSAGDCVYLTPDHDKCAVGCRIPDEWIHVRGRNLVNQAGGITGLFNRFPEVEQFIGAEHSELFRFHEIAQRLHDTSLDAAHFVARLDEYGLVTHGCDLPIRQEAPAEDRQLVTA